MDLSISILILDSQEGQVEGLFEQRFPWLDSHDYGPICYVEPCSIQVEVNLKQRKYQDLRDWIAIVKKWIKST